MFNLLRLLRAFLAATTIAYLCTELLPGLTRSSHVGNVIPVHQFFVCLQGCLLCFVHVLACLLTDCLSQFHIQLITPSLDRPLALFFVDLCIHLVAHTTSIASSTTLRTTLHSPSSVIACVLSYASPPLFHFPTDRMTSLT